MPLRYNKNNIPSRVLLWWCLLTIVIARAASTLSAPAESNEDDAVARLDPRTPVHVHMCSRSQWDPLQHFRPGRVVATMAIRMCTKVDDTSGLCTEEHDGWSTVVARNAYESGVLSQRLQMAKEHYGVDEAHLWELYHTTDNSTYIEQCAVEQEYWPLNEQPPSHQYGDQKFIDMARAYSISHVGKHMVVRLDHGRLWPVPETHWNAGERGLTTGQGVYDSQQTGDVFQTVDFRPTIYI